MDESTKIIIATLSGFIIAFFAEPVKNMIQHRTNLHNLKLALYKEMLSNYTILRTANMSEWSLNSFLSKPSLRTECYRRALENEVILFYQLEEAAMINSLQGDGINHIVDFFSYIKSLPSQDFSKNISSLTHQFRSLSTVFLTAFIIIVREGEFDTKLLKRLSKGEYERIMSLKPQSDNSFIYEEQ